MYRVTIERTITTQVNGVPGTTEGEVWEKRYVQQVDDLDMRKVFDAVNSVPRKSRAKKSDAPS